MHQDVFRPGVFLPEMEDRTSGRIQESKVSAFSSLAKLTHINVKTPPIPCSMLYQKSATQIFHRKARRDRREQEKNMRKEEGRNRRNKKVCQI